MVELQRVLFPHLQKSGKIGQFHWNLRYFVDNFVVLQILIWYRLFFISRRATSTAERGQTEQ